MGPENYRPVLPVYPGPEGPHQTQQEAVVHILEQLPPPSDVLQQLKAELTCIHGKSEWKWVGELFALPPLGSLWSGELLVQMKRLRPKYLGLRFCWQFFSRLLTWMRHQLEEDTGTVEHLAAKRPWRWPPSPPCQRR